MVLFRLGARSLSAVIFCAATIAAGVVSAAPAQAVTVTTGLVSAIDASATTTSALKQPVHYKRRHARHRHWKQRRKWHHRHHHHRDRDVYVDAPFTHVYSGRHGRRVIAPFVDIWIPN